MKEVKNASSQRRSYIKKKFQIKRFQKGNRDKKQNIGDKTERESDVLFPQVNMVNNDKCIKFAGGSEWP